MFIHTLDICLKYESSFTIFVFSSINQFFLFFNVQFVLFFLCVAVITKITSSMWKYNQKKKIFSKFQKHIIRWKLLSPELRNFNILSNINQRHHA